MDKVANEAYNEDVPHYDESLATDAPPSADLLLPETLCILDRFVRSKHPQGEPLYEFSHHLDSLKESDRKIVMQKLEKQVR